MSIFATGKHRACCQTPRLQNLLADALAQLATVSARSEGWRREFNTADKDRIVTEGLLIVRDKRIAELEAALARIAPAVDEVVTDDAGEYLAPVPGQWKATPAEADAEKTQPISRGDIPVPSWAREPAAA